MNGFFLISAIVLSIMSYRDTSSSNKQPEPQQKQPLVENRNLNINPTSISVKIQNTPPNAPNRRTIAVEPNTIDAINASDLKASDIQTFSLADHARLETLKQIYAFDHRIFVGQLLVPLDHHHLSHPHQVELAYLIHYAEDNPEQQPTLWLHFGGPGYSVMDDYLNGLYLLNYYDISKHFNDYNVVLLDGRATGYSGFSSLFEVKDGRSRLSEPAKLSQLHRFGRYYSTNTLIEDMELLRQTLAVATPERIALNTEKIHLLGISYGAAVYSHYTKTYPNHVASLILDSPPDLENLNARDLTFMKRDLIKNLSYHDNISEAHVPTNHLRSATMYISCADQGYYTWHDENFVNHEILNYYYDEASCATIKTDPLVSLRDATQLKDLDFPVFVVSSRQDKTIPFALPKRIFNQVYDANGIHMVIDSRSSEDQHAQLLYLMQYQPFQDQVLNYMRDPESIVRHTHDAINLGICHDIVNSGDKETPCLPSLQE